MNTPISRGSAILLALGAAAILLLGAFSHSNQPVAPVLAMTSPAAPPIEPAVAAEPELPADLSPGLAEIIRMVQAHVDQGVILEFIRASGQKYSPTANEILYLTDIGLSQTVIAALFPQKPSAPSESATAVAAATPIAPVNTPPTGSEANPRTFYTSLVPYGNWLQVPDYGLCWQPTAETVNADWRPYVDQGQWLYTDNGWYWQSGYTWGAIAFHYGRWTQSGRLGWVWVPDNLWGPAWVSWRIAVAYSGWAPLPPGVGLAIGSGLTFKNQRVAADFNFGIPAGWFTFVSEDNMFNPNLAGYTVQSSQVAAIFNRSVAVNNYSNSNKKIINLGPGRIGAAALADTPLPPVTITSNSAPRRILLDNAAPLAAIPFPPDTIDGASPKPRHHRHPFALPASPAPAVELRPVERRPAAERASNFAGITHWPMPFNPLIHREPEPGPPLAWAGPPEPGRVLMAPVAPVATASARAR